MKLKSVIILLLIGFTLANIFYSFNNKRNEEIGLKLGLLTLSKGENYFNKLKLWYFYAKNEKWDEARKLEKQIDTIDVEKYKLENDPIELKKQLEEMVVNAKSSDDWIKVAKVQLKLKMETEAKESIGKAFESDLARDDISKLYYGL